MLGANTVAVTDETINKMKQLIVSGVLAPGSRLPREADLAADLQVSGSSLRETLSALIQVRILEDRNSDGIYVGALERDLVLDAMDFLLEFHLDTSVLDIFGVRKILEPASSALAARQMSDESIAALRLFADSAQSEMSIPQLVDHDLTLHGLIARGSGNPVLSSILQSIGPPTRRARIWRGLTQTNALERTLAEHSSIVQAIERRDPELAFARTMVHIASVEDWLRATYDPTRDLIVQLPDWKLEHIL